MNVCWFNLCFVAQDKYKLTYGTTFKGYSESEENAPEDNAVTKLRKAGVVIIGITSAHEGGLGATGAALNRSALYIIFAIVS